MTIRVLLADDQALIRGGFAALVRSAADMEVVAEAPDGNGFVFHPYDPGAFRDALWRALQCYRDRAAWDSMRERGMREDHSWGTAARQYAGVYARARQLIGRA